MPSILLIPIVYLAAILETWLSPRWEVRGVSPDLLALVAFAWLASARGRYAFFIAAMIGLVSDLTSSAPLGIGMAAFAMTGYAVIYLRQNFHLDGIVARLGIVGIGVTTACLLQGVALRMSGHMQLLFSTFLAHAALVGLYTTIVAVPILVVLRWSDNQKPLPAALDQPSSSR